MRSLRGAPPVLLLLLTLLLAAGHGAVITGACDRDQQCGGGMCCAVSLWIRSLRMCTPMGNLGEECHPLSHREPGQCPGQAGNPCTVNIIKRDAKGQWFHNNLLYETGLNGEHVSEMFPSLGGGCTTPAHVSLAWPAYGLLPANSNVYRTSEKKMSFFSRSYLVLERATRCILFLVIVMNKVLARRSP
ncbi:hypothetical protein Q9966_007238 [Columba livia]|nr:hypothetical protein Q9966_007238 [Columba livia]